MWQRDRGVLTVQRLVVVALRMGKRALRDSSETREEVVEKTRAEMRLQWAKLRRMWEDELKVSQNRHSQT